MSKIQLTFLPLTIKELASIEISRGLLTLPSTKEFIKYKKDKTEQCSENTDQNEYIGDLLQGDQNVIFNMLKELHLPTILEKQIMQMIESMVYTMWDWLIVIHNLYDTKTDLDHYIDHMDWTPCGIVDEMKVMRSMFTSKVFPEDINTFAIFCELCIEDLILAMWPKIKEMELNKDVSFMATFWIHHELEEPCDDCKKHPMKWRVLEPHVFIIAAAKGNYWACKYIWMLLDNNKKQETITRLWELPWSDYIMANHKSLEVFIFLLQQLGREDVLNLLKMLLHHKPAFMVMAQSLWSHLIINMMRKSWDYLNFSDCKKFLEIIGLILHLENKIIPKDVPKWSSIFCEFWVAFKSEWKHSFNFIFIFHSLQSQKELLGFVMDDPILLKRRKELLMKFTIVNYNLLSVEKNEVEFLEEMEEWYDIFQITREEKLLIKQIVTVCYAEL